MNASSVSLIAVVFIILTPQVAEAAGPFGIEMGTSIATLPSCTHQQDGVYLCSTVPRPHSAFESYVIIAHPSTGICKVGGVGKDIDDNGYGLRVKEAVDELVEQVSSTYGPPTTPFDRLVSGSIWDERNDWLMGVLELERYYTFGWLEADGYVRKNNVTAIQVEARARASDSGYAILRFEFDNFGRCVDAINQKDKAAF